ncbi:MAG: hypothetical protein NTV58_06630 [Deltaproteobacteria bacterium]|nr:hypothetical protein [Deltaproteobacteria bacterium]
MAKIDRETMTIEEYGALPVDGILCDARFVLESGNKGCCRALAGTIMVLSGSIKKSMRLMELEGMERALRERGGRI